MNKINNKSSKNPSSSLAYSAYDVIKIGKDIEDFQKCPLKYVLRFNLKCKI